MDCPICKQGKIIEKKTKEERFSMVATIIQNVK